MVQPLEHIFFIALFFHFQSTAKWQKWNDSTYRKKANYLRFYTLYFCILKKTHEILISYFEKNQWHSWVFPRNQSNCKKSNPDSSMPKCYLYLGKVIPAC